MEDELYHERPTWPHDEYMDNYNDGTRSNLTSGLDSSIGQIADTNRLNNNKNYEWKRLRPYSGAAPYFASGPGFYDYTSGW